LSFPDRDLVKRGVIEKQIMSAWIKEVTMRTESVVCPLTVDATKPSSPNRLPFYFVHSIAGSAGAELGYLAMLIDPAQPLIAIQAPITRRRKEFVKSTQDLAEHYCHALLGYHNKYYASMRWTPILRQPEPSFKV
jgi:hypothetical protein